MYLFIEFFPILKSFSQINHITNYSALMYLARSQ